MGEVLQFEAGQEASDPEKEGDIQEVLNYRQALRQSIDALEDLA